MEEKQRHGCLTTWLILMIIANAGVALYYLFANETIRSSFPDSPALIFPLLAVIGFFNVACAVALFKWKKWGFWGFFATSIIALIINLSIGLSVAQSFGGLLGIAILYGVLKIGKEKAAWPQLD